jgi:hypothetical protein
MPDRLKRLRLSSAVPPRGPSTFIRFPLRVETLALMLISTVQVQTLLDAIGHYDRSQHATVFEAFAALELSNDARAQAWTC